MSQDTFDADAFMQQTIDAPLATEFLLCPTGTYKAMIDDFTSEALEAVDFEYKKGDRAGQPGQFTKFKCPFVIDDAAAQAKLGKDKVVVSKEMILDRDDIGQLDFGVNRNVDLGRIRNAVGQNNPGPWAIGQLRGAGPLYVKVIHETIKRKDGTKFLRAAIGEVSPIK